jgi:hypothetical protein
MTGVIATIPRIQFSNALGLPLAGGKLYTYLAGTTTPVATYQDQDLTTENENPIQLDSAGSCMIWLDPAKSYKFVLKSALGITQPGWPVDNISGAANTVSLTPTLSAYAKLTALAASIGAMLVGFIQLGAGAIIRTVLDELRERVSITQFGAKCDGATDDTAAVAAAQVAAAGRALVFPGLTNIAGPLTITAPIVDTSAQIFTIGSQVKINNGRDVRPEWWGAKADGAVECLAAINAALVAAVDFPVYLGAASPGYRTSGTITLSGDTTNGRQKLRGAGVNATTILYYGTGSAVQSNQGLADYCEASGFSIVNMATLGAQIGLDIGTARNGKFKDILAKNFLIGVDLQKNVDAVGDYYNFLENIVADCGAAPAGSIGFQFGNNLAGHTNPTSNANDLFGCRSYGCETAIWVNGTGNTILGHKIVSCKNQIRLIGTSYDNYIVGYCESQVATDSMGSADAGTVGNTLRLFNDALDLLPFVDNGWNNIIGNVQAGGLGYPAPARVLDCALTDHINVQGKNAASIPVFSIQLPDRDGAIRVVVTLCGYTFTIGTYAGVQQWSAYRKAAGTPVFNLDNTLSDNLFTVTAAADGTLTWSVTGNATAGIFTTAQITVNVQGVCADTSGLGSKIVYKRLV